MSRQGSSYAAPAFATHLINYIAYVSAKFGIDSSSRFRKLFRAVHYSIAKSALLYYQDYSAIRSSFKIENIGSDTLSANSALQYSPIYGFGKVQWKNAKKIIDNIHTNIDSSHKRIEQYIKSDQALEHTIITISKPGNKGHTGALPCTSNDNKTCDISSDSLYITHVMTAIEFGNSGMKNNCMPKDELRLI